MSELNRDQQIGELLARVTILERERIRFEKRVEEKLDTLAEDVGDMKQILAGAKGSWRALIAIGTFISVVSAAVGAAAHWFAGRS